MYVTSETNTLIFLMLPDALDDGMKKFVIRNGLCKHHSPFHKVSKQNNKSFSEKYCKNTKTGVENTMRMALLLVEKGMWKDSCLYTLSSTSYQCVKNVKTKTCLNS